MNLYEHPIMADEAKLEKLRTAADMEPEEFTEYAKDHGIHPPDAREGWGVLGRGLTDELYWVYLGRADASTR